MTPSAAGGATHRASTCSARSFALLVPALIAALCQIGTQKAYTMHITSASSDSYRVEYRRSFRVPFPARLEGDTIVVWGENASDTIWTLSYDPQSDRLTAVGRHDSFTFKRIPAPGT